MLAFSISQPRDNEPRASFQSSFLFSSGAAGVTTAESSRVGEDTKSCAQTRDRCLGKSDQSSPVTSVHTKSLWSPGGGWLWGIILGTKFKLVKSQNHTKWTSNKPTVVVWWSLWWPLVGGRGYALWKAYSIHVEDVYRGQNEGVTRQHDGTQVTQKEQLTLGFTHLANETQ